MTEPVIAVDGLKDVVRTLKKLGDEDMPAAIRDAGKKAAGFVVDEAVKRVDQVTQGKSDRRKAPGGMKNSIRAAGQARGAVVRGGAKRVRYFGWIDFGGKREGRGGGIAEREFLKRGRILYPALDAVAPDVFATYRDEIAELIRKVDR